jgi:arylsulfatase A-like enzyme
LPDRLATEATKFIDANKTKPFLIYFPFYDVHTPLQSRADLQAKYEAKRKQLGLEPKFGKEPPREVRLVQEHAVYAGMVEAMDAAVGKVLAKLDELGLAENTIVLFTSDNGGLSTSEGSPTSNLPYRGGKGWLYEGGIREPLIVRWPGKVKPGSTIDTPVCGVDLAPTLIDATGATKRPGQKLDGVSLVPVLIASGKLAERPLFWHYPHYGNQGGAPGAAMRLGDWKLIEWFEGKTELFNLATDISEKTDLAAQEPERVKAMLAQLKAWQAEVGAKFPTPNADYDPSKPDGRGATEPKAKAKGKGKAK